MYKRDNKKIAEFILRDADNTVIGITFVLGTIQNALSNVGKFMDGVANDGADSIAMTMKRNGYLYAVEHKHVLHEALKAAVKHNDPVGAIDVLTNVPNLGIVKAAFVAQLVGLDVACLDMHNLDMLGMSRSALKFDKGVKRETKLKKIQNYVALTQSTGGSEYWWNIWCNFVAGNRANKSLTTGDAVSAYHATCIIGV
jgi:hypothetical protein